MRILPRSARNRSLIALVRLVRPRCGRASCRGKGRVSRRAPAGVRSLPWQFWRLVLSQISHSRSALHWDVLDRGGVLRSLVPFHFVKSSDSRATSWQTSLGLGLWGRIASFGLLLVGDVARRAVPLDIRYVLPSGDSGKFIRSEATASEVHHSRPFDAFPCSSFSGGYSVPTRETRSTHCLDISEW